MLKNAEYIKVLQVALFLSDRQREWLEDELYWARFIEYCRTGK